MKKSSTADDMEQSRTGITESSLRKLEDIFLMICKMDSKMSDKKLEERKEMDEMLVFYLSCPKRVSDYYNVQRVEKKGSFANIVPHFMQMLRDCLLQHQWQDAVKVLQALTKENSYFTASSLWKGGLTSLYIEGERGGRLVEQFVKHLCILGELSCVEVLLDFLLYLLTHGNLEDAKAQLRELKRHSVFSKNLTNECRRSAHVLFHAYQGLVNYAEWKAALWKIDTQESEAGFINIMMSQGQDKRVAKGFSDKAVEFLSTVQEDIGVWDIFIEKLVEIHDFYERTEEALAVLLDYRSLNPSNPNAHLYLYRFASQHGHEKRDCMEYLSDLVSLDPSHPLALTLYDMMDPCSQGAVTLLFNFLDFQHCQKEGQAWKALAKNLLNLKGHEAPQAFYQEVSACWEIRRDWWPQSVLRGVSCNEGSKERKEGPPSHGLEESKAVVYELLMTLASNNSKPSELPSEGEYSSKKLKKMGKRKMALLQSPDSSPKRICSDSDT